MKSLSAARDQESELLTASLIQIAAKNGFVATKSRFWCWPKDRIPKQKSIFPQPVKGR